MRRKEGTKDSRGFSLINARLARVGRASPPSLMPSSSSLPASPSPHRCPHRSASHGIQRASYTAPPPPVALLTLPLPVLRLRGPARPTGATRTAIANTGLWPGPARDDVPLWSTSATAAAANHGDESFRSARSAAAAAGTTTYGNESLWTVGAAGYDRWRAVRTGGAGKNRGHGHDGRWVVWIDDGGGARGPATGTAAGHDGVVW